MAFDTTEKVLDFAINEETQAVKFYKDLASKMNNQTMKQVFLDFADEEAKHKQKLEDVKAGKIAPADFTQPIPDLKIADYIIDVEPDADMSYQSALAIAMKKEKSAYALYMKLADSTANLEIKNIFKSLAHEEANHKLRFELEYDEMIFEGN